jgi:hypothetical protein
MNCSTKYFVRKKQVTNVTRKLNRLVEKLFHESRLNKNPISPRTSEFRRAILEGVKLLASNILQSTKRPIRLNLVQVKVQIYIQLPLLS